MECTSRKIDKAMVIEVVGRMDAVTAQDFEKACGAWTDQGEKRFVVDLSALEYISSAGLRSFLILGKRIRAAGGTLVLTGLQGMVREVFEISGFATIFAVCSSREEALEATR